MMSDDDLRRFIVNRGRTGCQIIAGGGDFVGVTEKSRNRLEVGSIGDETTIKVEMGRGGSRGEFDDAIDRIVNLDDKFREGEVAPGAVGNEGAALAEATKLSNRKKGHLKQGDVEKVGKNARAAVDGGAVRTPTDDRDLLS